MKLKILLIESKRAIHSTLMKALMRKGYVVEHVASGGKALARLQDVFPDLVILNAASMRTSGRRICELLRAQSPSLPILLITEAAHGDALEKESLVNVTLFPPFTPQKLINRIRPLLPTVSKETLQLGDLQLDLVQRCVRVNGRQTSLSPRLLLLLRIFMEHPGQVLQRGALFQEVWNTDYIEDMRSLDVHISWLRQAIEQDPRRPQRLKTVRSVGYRLDP